ncbi:MAG: hypothetical protein LBF59_03655 [Prevotellaceae bacterium]|nr:hypothetical protein [Prevotellaceae bacterium]
MGWHKSHNKTKNSTFHASGCYTPRRYMQRLGVDYGVVVWVFGQIRSKKVTDLV